MWSKKITIHSVGQNITPSLAIGWLPYTMECYLYTRFVICLFKYIYLIMSLFKTTNNSNPVALERKLFRRSFKVFFHPKWRLKWEKFIYGSIIYGERGHGVTKISFRYAHLGNRNAAIVSLVYFRERQRNCFLVSYILDLPPT